MNCPRCQAQNDEGARFCEDCGARLEVTCTSCGEPVQGRKEVLSFLWRANPLFCAGLVRVAETYLQVGGRAGDRQVKGVSTGLAQATAGLAGQGSAVLILDRERPTRRV